MIKIVRITTQKNNKERFNIYIDQGKGEEYGFSVDQDVFIEYQLRKGKAYNENELEEIFFNDNIKKAYNMSLNYLSYRMRAEKEVHDYLISKSYSEEIANLVLKKLRNHHYVNDLEFAKAFVRSRIQSTTKGPIIIRQELQMKGLSDYHIQEGLKEFPEEKQLEMAIHFGEKKIKQKQTLSEFQRKQKIGQALISKGFSHPIVQTALSELSFETDEQEQANAAASQGAKAYKKYHQKFSGWELEQKIKQYLYQRGFKAEIIEKFIHDLKEEDKL